ncbi:transposase, partial [Bacteroides thetaiotaomicron]|nr:transposase [Bacteroides thetaiotaomicron]MBL3954728.1 transposase [Bacteroides thetaiotaomicron]
MSKSQANSYFSQCSVLNKLTLQKSKIKMKYSKKQYNY